MSQPEAQAKVDRQGGMTSKWDTTFYGFVEFDSVFDSTQSFNDIAGNAAIMRSGTYEGDHSRLTFGARNSRFGFKINAPTTDDLAASGQLEMDFLGNLPPGTAESAVYCAPIFRVRIMAMKLQTHGLDILIGQYWSLFGWQANYFPNSVGMQGLPGQVYSRTPQVRLSKQFKEGDVGMEFAIAGLRPPQRDSATPDGQAGARLFIDDWKGTHTMGATGTSVEALSLGLSGTLRRFAVKNFAPKPTTQTTAAGWGVSLDTLVPIIPSTAEDKGNALTLTVSLVTGAGIADQYTGLSGGAGYPNLPATNGVMSVYTPNIDNGLVTYGLDGSLLPIKWRSAMAGLQYYFPGEGNFWISVNYSWMKSDNITAWIAPNNAGALGRVFKQAAWGDLNVFWDTAPGLRFGLEGSHFAQTYGDGVSAHDWRGQFSSYYIF